MASNGTPKDKSKNKGDVDLSHSARGVWLVKVPKYIADRWERAKDGTDVGQLRIQGPRQKPFWPQISLNV